MSSKTLQNTNLLLHELGQLTDELSNSPLLQDLAAATINWPDGRISTKPEARRTLARHGFIEADEEPAKLTETGIALLAKLLIDLPSIVQATQPINQKYQIIRLIAHGKHSATFLVTHVTLGRQFVLKVVRPGSGRQLETALKALGSLEEVQHLVQPFDYFSLHVAISGTEVPLQCIVYPFVNAVTLREFLAQSPPLSPHFVSALIEQLARPLAALEKIGAYHGDLHADNILVRQPSQGQISLYIIDISYGIGTPSGRQGARSDFEHFQEHLWRSLQLLQKAFPGMSLQKHLGARIHSLAAFILENDRLLFSTLVDFIETDRLYREFVVRRDEFMRNSFREPSGLYLLRYEEFTNPAVAIELFEPFPGLLNKISNFGNALLYGHRGSGKSTYLAALAFFPEVKNPIAPFHKKFGIFFACRQGEFKQFTPDLVCFDAAKLRHFKHILVLKIVRRLVHALSQAIQMTAMRDASSYDALYSFLQEYVACGELGAYDNSMVFPLENLHVSLLRGEILEIESFFGRGGARGSMQKVFDERTLIAFLLCVKSVFSDLSEAQFFLIFDDAGAPNVPIEAQKVINDLARATNSVYCVKLSAERYSYVFEDTTGKALEDPHDITVFDISHSLFLGSGRNPERDEVDQYFRKILQRRLMYLKYNSFEIIDYLGDELVAVDDLVEALASGRRNAYFAGWQCIWQLADRTVRNLLELVNAIFADKSISPASRPRVVPARIQNSAVRSVSERKLRALSYIPGTIELYGGKIALGRRLYEFTAAFGAVAQAYLKHGHRAAGTKARRFDERIAVERNDFRDLSPSARLFLENLIRYGILDDSHLAFSRDDKLKKPLYILNRIFCPALSISFRRDQHLRLTSGKFELLLIDPVQFARSGTRFLELHGKMESQDYGLYGLFE